MTRLTDERVKPIPGFPGYFACSDGFVWSNRRNKGLSLSKKASYPNHDGYPTVALTTENGLIRKSVHRLVAMAFHGVPKEKLEVRHLDGSRTNNRPENLKWGTHRENGQDMVNHGRCFAPLNGVRGAHKKRGTGAGVLKTKRIANPWTARTFFHGQKIPVGNFPTKEQAEFAYKVATKVLNIIDPEATDAAEFAP